MIRLLRNGVTTTVLVILGVLNCAQEGMGGNFFDDMYNTGKISKESSSMEAMWAAEFEGKPYVTKPPKVYDDPLLALLTEKPKTGFETNNTTTSRPGKNGFGDDDFLNAGATLAPANSLSDADMTQETTPKPKRKRTRSTTTTTEAPANMGDAPPRKSRRKKQKP